MIAALLGLSADVRAMGVGNPTTLSALGESLNLRFPISLSPGESLNADCVRAEVWVGDSPVPPRLLQLQVVGASESTIQALHVQVALPMQEPIVRITLKLGCPVRLTRQYAAFIDPPKAPNGFGELNVPGLSSTQALQSQPPQPLLRQDSSGLSAAMANAVASAAAGRTSGVPGRQAAAKETRAERAVNKLQRSASPARSEVKASASSGPKLRLEMPEPLDLVLQRVSVPGSADRPDPSLQRLQRLEDDLASLRQGNSRIEAQLLALKAQRAKPQPRRPSDVWAFGSVLVLLGLTGAGFYFWRSRSAALAADEFSTWYSEIPHAELDQTLPTRPAAASNFATTTASAARVPTAPTTATGYPDELTLEFSKLFESDSKPELERSAGTASPEARDRASPAYAFVHDFSHEPLSVQFVDSSQHAATSALLDKRYEPNAESVSGQAQLAIEDLIDLEQQVEFFLVLGQDDAAEELLLNRINTGLTNALPYLKLLEIYQRLGRESAFQGIAARFAVRFRAQPPTWGDDLTLGQSLESYPEVMQDLQIAWASHGYAMVKVQALLSAGAEQFTGFDLPAYLDLLLLYSLARDLSEHEVRGEDIDLFLPLDVDPNNLHGHSMMATISWQGPPLAFGSSAELDICLDDVPLDKS